MIYACIRVDATFVIYQLVIISITVYKIGLGEDCSFKLTIFLQTSDIITSEIEVIKIT